jgi:hypothetical protein
VVQELRGARGGLFVDRFSALRYVRSESGDGRQLAMMVGGVFDLDMSKILARPTAPLFPAAQTGARGVA